MAEQPIKGYSGPITLSPEQATNPKVYRQARAEALKTGRILEIEPPADQPLFVLEFRRGSGSTLAPITLSPEQATNPKVYRQARAEAIRTGRALAIG